MRFAQSVALVKLVHSSPVKRTLLFLGPPGIGKSSVAREAAHLFAKEGRNVDVVYVDLSSSMPEDLNGIPKTDGDVMRFVPDSWLYKVCQPDSDTILVLDDLPAASPQIQVATRQLALDRRVHNHVLGPKVTVIVTGNRTSDGARAMPLPTHFINSVLSVTVEPDMESWRKWYQRQPHLDQSVVSFLLFQEKYFSQLPNDKDRTGSFATPRTWAMLGEILPEVEKLKDKAVLREVTYGLIGQGVGVEFLSFREIQKESIDIELFLLNPEQAMPDPHSLNHSYLFAVCSSAVQAVYAPSRKKDDKFSKERAEMLVRALAHVCKSGKRDLVVMSFKLVQILGGDDAVSVHKRALMTQKNKEESVKQLINDTAELYGSI